MKLTLDDKKEYILELEDTIKPQVFDIHYSSESKDKLLPIKTTFEILDIYKGTHYEDTALTALNLGITSNTTTGI